MIPTTVSSSPSTATISGTTGNNNSTSNNGQLNSLSTPTSGTISGSVPSPASAQTPSITLGLASLILEGRAVADDEYQPQAMRVSTVANDAGALSGSSSGSGTGNAVGSSNMHNYIASSLLASTSYGISGSSSGAVGGGRQSPTCRPSTSRAAASFVGGGVGVGVGSGHVINITTNPYAFSNSSMGGAHAHDSSPLYIDPYSNSSSGGSAASSAESTHQRWTQKLCQLRQVSPAASLSTTYEQPVAVEAREPELVALAINESGATERGDFEIVRRSLLNRANLNAIGSSATSTATAAGSSAGAGSASSSPGSGSGSENFLLSLQSLATTCLRSGSPSIEPSIGGMGASATGTPTGYRFATLSSPPPPQSMYMYRATTPTAATTAHRFLDPPGSGSSCGSGVQSPRPHWSSPAVDNNSSSLHPKERYMRHSAMGTGRIPIPGTAVNATTATTAIAAASTINNTTKIAASTATAMSASTTASKYPQQGPHCDQFLKKMGLAKGEAAEAEDHFCDMSYVNITCSRWRAYCHKMEAIMGRGEPICIEVYLGPVNHKILLEQWIITQREKVPPPTMTLPSLCSAIRSQLYFSQISAWCDLIKKSDKTIYDTGRIIFATPTGAAGDLATPLGSAGGAGSSNNINITPGTSPNTHTLNQLNCVLQANRRPRLNIFYRIKSFDSTACFNSKPNVHNFPNVNISENCSISVCLKSLPRINGGIPKIGTLMLCTPGTTSTITAATTTTIMSAVTSKASSSKIKTTIAATPPSTAASTSLSLTTTPGTPQTLAASNGSDNSRGPAAFRNGNSCFKSEDTPRSSRSGRCPVATTALGDVTASTLALMPATSGAAQTRVFINNPPAGNDPPASSVDTTSAISSLSSSVTANSSQQAVSNGKSGDGVTASSDKEKTESSGSHTSSSPKQKCMFFIDEDELLVDEADAEAFGDEYNNMSDTTNSIGESITGVSSFSSSGNISHREKQLMKYRKRMLKRDKMHQHQHHPRKPLSTSSDSTGELGATLELQRRQQEQSKATNGCQPMEEGDEDASVCCSATVTTLHARTSTHIEMISTGTQTPMSCCRQCGWEKTLVCLRCTAAGSKRREQAIDEPTEPDIDDMDDSTASSISSSEIIQTPRNKAELLLQAIQRTPKAAAAKHKKEQPRKPCGSKAQNNNHLSGAALANGNADAGVGRAGSISSSNENTGSGCQVCKRQKTQHNFGNSNVAKVSVVAGEQLQEEGSDADDDIGDDTDDDGGKKHEDIAFDVDGAEPVDANQLFVVAVEELPATPLCVLPPHQSEVMEEESFLSSTKLTPHIDRCSLSTSGDRAGGDQTVSGCNRSENRSPPIITALMEGGCFNESQFKTPTSASSGIKYETARQQQQQQSLQRQPDAQKAFQHKQTPKPNLLQLHSNYLHGDARDRSMQAVGASGDGFCVSRVNNEMLCTTLSYSTTPATKSHQQSQPGGHNALLLRKGLPKVNLTPIFCNPMPTTMGATITSCQSSPIPIHGAAHDNTFCFEPTALNRSGGNQMQLHHQLMHSSNGNDSASLLTTDANNIPVQKSFSAPTLPNSPSLSPRFAKQAASYKRRSRHLSDRSDRSSLGSDEQFSDEDLESGGMYSPATSPLKQCARVAAAFGRQRLLGNLEESLLQKRLMPKVEVMGFKVLLGASGGFCPTQLTIPAAAYFYELHGEALSTPYVCDIRLPRKGYSVPRSGTVQATLLNPMGTVVRMFVIPYDMRDMPPLHQTFIRQRILAEASTHEATTQNVQPSQQSVNIVEQQNDSNGMVYTNGFESSAVACGGGDDTLNLNNNNNDCYQNGNNTVNAKNKYRLSPSGGLHGVSNLGHFISAEHMKRLRYSIHLRFQTSRSGRLSLHTDIRLLISRRTDLDTAAAHAKGVLEAPNDLVTDTVMPTNPKYSARQDQSNSSGGSGGGGSSGSSTNVIAAAATNCISTTAAAATAATTTTNNSNGSASSKI
ncbi:serine-rich adhesin for platelets [Rhagoletis pomonella]|uniref:serine-rich adhesin for platelets n=1 Tax=Rhagoletis pomonella TaxID=28610 RepID=UPI00177FD7D0|nr:serine-rich adhesin for platelets [Rhagoletis pomonella]